MDETFEFADGINFVFKRWTVLNLALSMGWGAGEAKEKRDLLIDEIEHLFSRDRETYKDEVEELLLDFFDGEFECQVEDGSAAQVARVLCLLYQDYQKKDFTQYVKLRELAGLKPAKVSECVRGGDDEDWESDEGSASDGEGSDEPGTADAPVEPVEPRRPKPVVDEDGWTVMPTKSRGKKQPVEEKKE